MIVDTEPKPIVPVNLDWPVINEITTGIMIDGIPPKAKNIEDVLYKVNQWLLYKQYFGGVVNLPPTIDYKPYDPSKDRPIRPSAAGKCPRALAYKKLHPEQAESLTSRAVSVFLLGHVIHEIERSLIGEVVDLHMVEAEVVFDLNGTPISGHIDGVIELETGPVLLDVKTTNSAAFDRMVREGASDDYKAQLNVYMEATGIHEAYLWLFNKDTSHRAVVKVDYDPYVVAEVRERWTSVQNATADNLPDRAYAYQEERRKGTYTGRDYLPWQCTYCAFTEMCWANEGFNKVIENGKPRYIREGP